MTWLRAILQETFGLFVDNGSFAVAILAWLALTGLALPRLGVAAGWEGLILFAGLATILVVSAARQARR